jgi:hypothetical protein
VFGADEAALVQAFLPEGATGVELRHEDGQPARFIING